MFIEGAYLHRWMSVNTTNNNIQSFWQNNFNKSRFKMTWFINIEIISWLV